jgi:hypothetical protein
MEAGSCSEMLFTTKLDGATSQKTTIVILVAMAALIFHLCCICYTRRGKENVIAVRVNCCVRRNFILVTDGTKMVEWGVL